MRGGNVKYRSVNQYIGEYVSHAKAIILGEHSIVHGGSAIACPIPQLTLRARCVLVQGSENSFLFEGTDIRKEDLPSGYPGISSVLENVKIPDGYGIELSIESLIPQSRGLGSSAASALAVAKAVTSAINNYLIDNSMNANLYTEEQIAKLVSGAEDAVHTRASGLDQAAVSSDSTIFFTKGSEGINHIELLPKLDAYLVVADTGMEKNTGASVSAIAERLNRGDRMVIDSLHILGSMAVKHREHCDVDHISEIGTDMNLAQSILASLDLSTVELEQLIDVMVECGALGAKLSGGGCGGIAVGLFADADCADSAVTNIEAIGKMAWKVEI